MRYVGGANRYIRKSLGVRTRMEGGREREREDQRRLLQLLEMRVADNEDSNKLQLRSRDE